MGRKYTGLGPEEREKKAAQEILSLFPETGEVSWQFLAKEAEKRGISKATLSKHLKRFVNLNLVSRRVDTSTYPPRTYYQKTFDEPSFLKEAEIFEKAMMLILDVNIPLDKKIPIISFHVACLDVLFSSCLFIPPLKREEEIKGLVDDRKARLQSIQEMVLHFLNVVAKLMVSLNDDGKRRLQEILVEPLIEKQLVRAREERELEKIL